MPADYAPFSDRRHQWECAGFGRFIITGTAEQLLDARRQGFDAKKLSKIVRESPRSADGQLHIDEYNLDGFLQRA
jgi:hypothetical protein